MATATSRLQVIIDVMTGKSAKNVSGLETNLKSMLSTIGAITAGALVFGAAVKRAFDMAKEGAQLQLVEERFNRLAESIGTTGDALISDLKPAMGGMLSQAEMMASATDLMALGLVKTHEEAIRVTGSAELI